MKYNTIKTLAPLILIICCLAATSCKNQGNKKSPDDEVEMGNPGAPDDTLCDKISKIANSISTAQDFSDLVKTRDYDPSHAGARYYIMKSPIHFFPEQYIINDTSGHTNFPWQYWACVRFGEGDSVKMAQAIKLISGRLEYCVDTTDWKIAKTPGTHEKNNELLLSFLKDKTEHTIHLTRTFDATTKVHSVVLSIK